MTAVMSMPGFPTFTQPSLAKMTLIDHDGLTPPTEPQSGVQAEPTFPETCLQGLHLHTMINNRTFEYCHFLDAYFQSNVHHLY